MEQTARSLKVDLGRFHARRPGELEPTVSEMARAKAGGVVVHEDTTLLANAKAIALLTETQRLPGSGFPEFAEAGGLMAYGIRFPDMDRRAATYVDRILKG